MKLKRIVVKIGSSLILEKDLVNLKVLSSIIKQIAQLKKLGCQIILVSSGAIVLGKEKIGFKKQWPENLAGKQALSAVGQIELMNVYKKFFEKQGFFVAQILLSREDVSSWKKYLNIKNTLFALLEKGIIPIINENDTTSTEEIQFGDNDTLASLIAVRTESDLLINLSDVDGLYGPDQKVIKKIKKITPEIEALSLPKKGKLTQGGMSSKIKAAKISLSAGVPCIIANGKRKNILIKIIIEGKEIGTKFLSKKKIKIKKNWFLFGGLAKGELIVDKGAEKAIKDKGSSLLPVGIKRIKGSFEKGTLVKILNEKNQEFARGLSSYNSEDLKKIISKKIKTFPEEVVHRNNLVVF